MDNNSTIRLIVYGDSKEEATIIAKMLSKNGYKIQAAQAIQTNNLDTLLIQNKWDFIFSTITQAVTHGEEINGKISAANQTTSLLAISEDNSSNNILDALKNGARDILTTNDPERCLHIIKRELGDLAERRSHRHFEKKYKEQLAKDKMISNLNQLDLLTGLYNSSYFNSEINKITTKTTGSSILHGLLFIDLGKLGTIREKTGLSVSDLILGEIANLIKNNLDDSMLISRYQEYVFTVLIPDSSIKKINQVANNILNDIKNYRYTTAKQIVSDIECYIGISITGDKLSSGEQLISQARTASSIAETNGSENTHIFNPKTDTITVTGDDEAWEQRIRNALENDRFRLAYLPIVNLHKEPAENYELLIRMIGNNNAEILPGEFMPTAASIGLMTDIDRWVVKRAIEELSNQYKQGKNTSFFIKLSSDTFDDALFPTWLRDTLSKANLPADKLVFELSENVVIKQPDKAKKLVAALKSIRCRIALDHFGTDNNSLTRMNELPIDVIKIDRSFIQDLAENKAHKDKIKLIVGNAHSSDIIVLAEFVEDANSLSILWQCGVDYIQGHFLQKADAAMSYDFSEGTL